MVILGGPMESALQRNWVQDTMSTLTQNERREINLVNSMPDIVIADKDIKSPILLYRAFYMRK